MKKVICGLMMAAMLGGASLGSAADEPKKPDLEARFKNLDKNGDGKLSLEEFLGKRTGEQAEVGKKAFARKDKDKDGLLSLEEFKAMPKKKDAS